MAKKVAVPTVAAPATTPAPVPPSAVATGAVGAKAGLAAKLAALNKGKAPPKAGGTPSVTITVEVEKMVDGKPTKVDAIPLYLDAMKREKDAGREMDDLFGPIAEASEFARVNACRAAGEIKSSVKVNNRLVFVQQDRYLTIPASDTARIEKLQAIFGEQLFDSYFKVISEVKIVADTLDDAMLDDLMAICAKRGVEFSSIFETKQVLKPQSRLTSDRVLLPEIEVLFQKAQEDGLIRPIKASLKENS